MLDKAASTDEAVNLLKKYDMHFSKGKSTVAVMQPLGVVVAEPHDVAHTERELGELASFFKSLPGETKVIMESTGHYNDPINGFVFT